MLTDYHMHLRSDDLGATVEDHFNEDTVDRFLDAAKSNGVGDIGFSEHVYRFREALEVWDHPFWRENATDDLDRYCEFLTTIKDSGRPIKMGLEIDWIRGKEDQLAAIIDAYPWDYVLGSVHFIGNYSVDYKHPDYDIWLREDVDKVWSLYFDALGEAAASGLFDILSHPDLVKIWGKKPEGDLRRFYEASLDRIAEADIAVEVSTAGLRKPVGEIYPSTDLLKLFIDAGKPMVLSSDAHRPEDLGYRYDLAQEYLRSVGVTEIAVFNKRRRSMAPLG